LFDRSSVFFPSSSQALNHSRSIALKTLFIKAYPFSHSSFRTSGRIPLKKVASFFSPSKHGRTMGQHSSQQHTQTSHEGVGLPGEKGTTVTYRSCCKPSAGDLPHRHPPWRAVCA
jgi:hypothetical protein